MQKGRVILASQGFDLTIDRLCHQLIEEYSSFEDACLVGIQPRGVLFADRIHQRLCQILRIKDIPYGKLDITFYRDDFRTRTKPLQASSTQMEFLVENKRVLLIDDVLYTGRTVQAALTALQHYGRASGVELLVLVDRRFNRHLPIQADYVGLTVDALDEAYVKVDWKDIDGEDKIIMFADKKDKG
ncbi:MAG: bifunctional pyr operon transcriptional regulator/uracil phosphoribosyltransferase PyrR [Bacteroidota bacterium]